MAEKSKGGRSGGDGTDFLYGPQTDYLVHLYGLYLNNPGGVDNSWREFFNDLGEDDAAILREMCGASWGHKETSCVSDGDVEKHVLSQGGVCISPEEMKSSALDSIRALRLIRSYRMRGHLMADLDPLGVKPKDYHPELELSYYGFTKEDNDRDIFIDNDLGVEYATLGEIHKALKKTYCGTVGVEYMHIPDPVERKWIQRRIENIHNRTDFTVKGKKAILQRLVAAEMFENFLHKKYPGTKRFGLDGGEVLIPAIEQIMKRGGMMGVKEIVLGMSHRGRLNVLTNVMGKPFTAVFAEFQGHGPDPASVLGSGDVKYHLGTSGAREFNGHSVHLSLAPNPSHLEAVNPVVIGKVRAKQKLRDDTDRREVMPVLLHGDASFAGQGIVAEALTISELPGYRVGGAVHIVVNNQIGFTTTPKYGRSGPYPTDVAKMLAAPIFHVNGDDPEAVVHVARVATEFRQEFGKDVVLDIYCYRRYGHNEGDEPSFTQPLMYQKISSQITTKTLYANQLLSEGVISEEEIDEMEGEFYSYLDEAFKVKDGYQSNSVSNVMGGKWQGLKPAYGEERRGKTAVAEENARKIGKILTDIPEEFHLHRKLERFMDKRRAMFDSGDGFDWATAEALAFGGLVDDGFKVRLSGQDSGRGTFSQRHATLCDQQDNSKFRPLEHVKDVEDFEVHNSPLSEAAVLGFEYGYSLVDPNTLVLWEAQFGDFANVAQAIIDQFVSCGEAKWNRMSGLVLLLPHGQEGQGPEHSSARLERYLQLSGDDNWQVCNCTTPANYFHVLRRQMCRDFRKPLVLMTPKSLLRHKLCVSSLSEMTGESTFHRYLEDDDLKDLVAPDKIKRVICCSGKVYYDLLQERRKREIKDIMILRIEQLFPFPMKAVSEHLAQFANAEIVWCQEEPKNQGAWFYMAQKYEELLDGMDHKCKRVRYVGRREMSAPSTGYLNRFVEEQNDLVNEALG